LFGPHNPNIPRDRIDTSRDMQLHPVIKVRRRQVITKTVKLYISIDIEKSCGEAPEVMIPVAAVMKERVLGVNAPLTIENGAPDHGSSPYDDSTHQ
jgi:hypothetical protein